MLPNLTKLLLWLELVGVPPTKDFWWFIDMRSGVPFNVEDIDWRRELCVELAENLRLDERSAMYLSGMYLAWDGWLLASEPCHQSADSWPLISSQSPFLNESSFSERPL